jgi:2-aminoethylphosphonate transport system substrate-binding protein
VNPGAWAGACACTLAITLATVSCSGGGSKQAAHAVAPNTVGYCKGTTPGSQVVVYSTTGLDYWYSDILTAFQDDCHVNVVFQSDTSPNIEQQLEIDKARPYADVVIAEAPDLTKADQDDLLVPGGTPGSSGVPASRCAPHRDWCDVIENYISFVYNPTLVKDPPSTLDDLLAPRFAGHVLLSDLALADDGRALLDLLDLTVGRAATLRYITALEPLVKSHWIVTDTMSRLVSEGKALVANGNFRENLNDVPQYGNLVIWFPFVGVQRTTIAMPYGAALVRGGHHHANAVALLEFMWSKVGQAAVADAPGLPARTDVDPTDCRSQDMRKRLADVRIIRPDWVRVARDQQVLDAAWQRLKHAPYGVPPPATGIPPLEPC